MSKKIISAAIGIILLGISINVIVTINLGYAGFDAFSLEVQKILGLKYIGNASLLINFVFAFILLIYFIKVKRNLRELVVSLLSIFITTRVINLFTFVQNYDFLFYNIYVTFFIVLFLISLAVLLISKANIIIPPYDKFVVELANFIHIELGIVRAVSDGTILLISYIIGYIFNEPLAFSIFTLLLTFGLGTFVSILDYLGVIIHKHLISKMFTRHRK